ncbi:hypothetical protein [Thiomonas sp. FB-Cd]|uniref:hypothetical protein n=1 Tax=Thiomonas sp. FB-Cd TaxID=1158292 RepID=UPI000B092950|nr:hypothetical protein [Thiomonas sp. FB-Cd]
MKIGFVAGAVVALSSFLVGSALADAPSTTIAYQPMISTGLAAQEPFEAWFVFDKSFDPSVPGLAIPAGATIRFTFPEQFTPKPGLPLGSVMIRWTQGSVPAKFSVQQDPQDPRVIAVHFNAAVPAGEKGNPGIKAIHLRTPEINPEAGDYPISVQFVDAGPLSGTTHAVARITPKPVPNIAVYNQLHGGKGEDWQRVGAGEEAPIPIDFLATLPDQPRASLSLAESANGGLTILADGKPVGSISATGAPVTLTPHPFGPGYARLGIVEVRAKAGSAPGMAQIVAELRGGPQCVIHLVIQ